MRLLYPILLVVAFLTGCAKIDGFKNPKATETFSGSLSIINSKKGEVGEYLTVIVSFSSDGKRATLNNMTGILVMSLEDGARVSGVVGNVIDDETIEVDGFASANSAALETNTKISGTVKLDKKNAKLYTVEPHLIIKQTLDDNGTKVTREVRQISFAGSINTVF